MYEEIKVKYILHMVIRFHYIELIQPESRNMSTFIKTTYFAREIVK